MMILIGLMGSGKSTIGKLLASRLSLSFVDLDDIIVQEQGKSIPAIFEQEGENGFRALESQALEEVLKGQSTIIVTGGGAILFKQNRDLMKQAGKVVWLDAPPPVLATRISGDANRPLLLGIDPLEKMKTLTAERNPLYEGLADLRIDTDLVNTKEAVDTIAAFLSE